MPVVASDRQIADSLVFVPASLSDSLAMANDMPVVDSVFAKLLSRNNENADFVSRIFPVESDSIGEYEKRILALEEESGAFAPELTEVLHTLGKLYMEHQRYDEALASFEREEYITRVHQGLFSEAQVPSVEAQIRALVAMKKSQEADDKHQYLIYLLGKTYGRDDPRLLPELIAYGEWNISRFNEIVRYDLSQFPLLGLGSGAATQSELREKGFENLDEATDHYVRATRVLLKNERFDDPALYQLEQRLTEAAYLQANRQQLLRDADDYQHQVALDDAMLKNGPYARLVRDAFRYGIQSYERQLAYISNDPQGSLARYVETMMALGDWYLMFGKHAPAEAKYSEARELLESMDVSRESIARVMAPEIPVAIPTFTARPHTPEQVEQKGLTLNPYRGYVDVSFRVNRNGKARDMKVLGSSENTTRTIEKRLLNTIVDSRFRPQHAVKDLAADDHVELRYFYTY